MTTLAKYDIGDLAEIRFAGRLPGTNFIVRGVMTDSKGLHRYFLQIFDNSTVRRSAAIVIGEDELEMVMSIAIQCLLEK